jgi:hypothetical protein
LPGARRAKMKRLYIGRCGPRPLPAVRSDLRPSYTCAKADACYFVSFLAVLITDYIAASLYHPQLPGILLTWRGSEKQPLFSHSLESDREYCLWRAFRILSRQRTR